MYTFSKISEHDFRRALRGLRAAIKNQASSAQFFGPNSVDLLGRRLKRLQINLAQKLCAAELILGFSGF